MAVVAQCGTVCPVVVAQCGTVCPVVVALRRDGQTRAIHHRGETIFCGFCVGAPQMFQIEVEQLTILCSAWFTKKVCPLPSVLRNRASLAPRTEDMHTRTLSCAHTP